MVIDDFLEIGISTHAPAQGATRDEGQTIWHKGISTHAPAQGATGSWRRRSPHLLISTHAPAQGATKHGGADAQECAFQPTLPHRERLIAHVYADLARDFNPRSRTGSDRVRSVVEGASSLFQPTLPHRERLKFSDTKIITPVFQPTLPHRERPQDGVCGVMASVFQPTLPHRERPIVHGLLHYFIAHFNPRSRTGSDCAEIGRDCYGFISTHAPAQGATLVNF